MKTSSSELASVDQKDKTKKGSADFKDKLAKFINPFYVSFVIFWVVCNYDFLLILIGKKAILHDIYAHFGYGCGVLNITDDGKIYTNYQLNLFACVEKSRGYYALYFAMWKVAIPLGLTWLHTHFVYPKIIAKINVRDKLNKENEGMEIKTNANLRKENKELIDSIAEFEQELMKATPSKPLINKIP